MAKLIFSTKSYLVLFKFEESCQKVASDIGNEAGFRVVMDQTIDDLRVSINKIQKMVVVLVNGKDIDRSVVAQAKALLETAHVPFLILGNGAPHLKWDGSTEYFSNILRAYLRKLLPPRMEEVAVQIANYVQPKLMPELPLQFSPELKNSRQYDVLITCDTVSDPWIARFHARLSLERMRGHCPAYAEKSEAELSDRIRELANQFLGIMNMLAGQQSIPAKISLPTEVRLNETTQVAPAIFMPSVKLSDPLGIIAIEFFSLNTAAGEGLDYSKIVLDFPDGAVEFL